MCWPSTEPGRAIVGGLDPAAYRRHPIHGEDRTWGETNCYTDLLVELLHALGHEPAAMLPFTLAIDFEGDQWTFFKPPLAELHDLYGLDIQELAIWRPVLDHAVEQVDAGRPVLVEVDSYFLPDTAGSSYRSTHGKTTIAVNAIDAGTKRLGYFHNAGYFALGGEDFDGVFAPGTLPPYCELVKWRRDFRAPRGAALAEASLALVRRHHARAPAANPFIAFKARFERDLEWLMHADLAKFHAYSFATLRQLGACYELAATNLRWLGASGVDGLADAAAGLQSIAGNAKAFQFQLARSMARRKPLDTALLLAMGESWQHAFDGLGNRLR